MGKHFIPLILFIGLLVVSHKEPTPELKQSRMVIKPPDQIEYMTFGYDAIIADSLWVRLIQDFDYCGDEGAITDKVEFEKDREEFLQAHLSPSERREITHQEWKDKIYSNKELSKCHMGWVYHMVNAITKLSPDFRFAFLKGANMLSVLVDDPVGAGLIYEKALERFPTDWKLAYHAGYHYLYELRSPAKAATLLRQSVENGGPQWIYSLIGQLYSKTGQAKIAKLHLEAFLKRNPDSRYSDRIRGRLNEVLEILKAEKEEIPSFEE